MPALAPWRRERQNLARKGAYDASLVYESEISAFVTTKKREEIRNPPGSPDTVVARYEEPPELLMLPGAWTVVGKGGRKVKPQDLKMYDEPLKKKPKKKKNRKKMTRDDDDADDADDFFSALAETPASSKCLDMHARSTAQHAKEASRALDKKYWQRYQQTRVAKHKALQSLIATLEETTVDDDDHTMVLEPPVRRFTRNNEYAKKKRRASRLASAARRCYSPDDEEQQEERIISPPDGAAKAKLKMATPSLASKTKGTQAPEHKKAAASSSAWGPPPSATWTKVPPSDKRKASSPPGTPPHGEARTKSKKMPVKREVEANDAGSKKSACSMM